MRTGADPPWRDPRRWHGVPMEGYFWRVTHAASGDAAIVYSAVCRGGWGLVGVAARIGGVAAERWTLAEPAWADPQGLGVRIGDALEATEEHVRVRLADARVDLDVRATPVRRPLHTMGLPHLVPRLPQYWHAHVLAAPVTTGSVTVDGRHADLGGARAYAEKNWSPGRAGFPGRWWWGHAHDFGSGDDVTVAFAGGPVAGVPATVGVIAIGGSLLRTVPFALVDMAPGRWSVRTRAGRHTVTIEAAADPATALVLQAPLPAERRTVPVSRHHLAGGLRVHVRRGGRTVYTGESVLAGLEHGG